VDIEKRNDHGEVDDSGPERNRTRPKRERISNCHGGGVSGQQRICSDADRQFVAPYVRARGGANLAATI